MKSVDLMRTSKRQAIKDQLKKWFAAQNLKPGDQILSQNELAEHFGVTAVTIHQALTELAKDGVLHRINGKGTFIGQAPRRVSMRRICLVLPGEHLEEPEHNPHYWSHVQYLYRSFLGALGKGHSFSTHAVAPDQDVEQAAMELQQYDAVFFHHTKEPQKLWSHMCREKVVPVVAFGVPIPSKGACLTLNHDKTEAVRRGVTYLAELGHRKIGFIGSKEWWGDLAFKGYRQALEQWNLAYNENMTVRIGNSRDEGYRGASVLIERGLTCDALFVDLDMHALGVLDCLRRANVRVPEDVGVMGYEGLDNATKQPPYLTSIDLPYREMILAALDELEDNDWKPFPQKHMNFVGSVLPGLTTMRRTVAAEADAELATK